MINKILSLFRSPHYGEVIVTTVLPFFCNHASVTNKAVWFVTSLEETTAEVINAENGATYTRKSHVFYSPITQNKKRIVVNKKFKLKEGDYSFEKDGYQVGQIFAIHGGGFLNNITTEIEIIFISDQFIFAKRIKDSSLVLYSFREMEDSIKTKLK